MYMIINNLLRSTFKGMRSRQPFINNDAKGILIRSATGCTLESFWSNISKSTLQNVIIDQALFFRVEARDRNPKVTQHYMIGPYYQHILRLQVTMHSSLVMGVLQALSNLIYVGHDLLNWDNCFKRMTIP